MKASTKLVCSGNNDTHFSDFFDEHIGNLIQLQLLINETVKLQFQTYIVHAVVI